MRCRAQPVSTRDPNVYFDYNCYIRVAMPIDIDRFHSEPEETLQAGGPTNAERVLSFLAANADRAFTPKEIHEATDVARGSVGVVLSRLADDGLVDHRGEYWAVADPDDAATTLAASETARLVTERFDDEDPEEWGPGGSENGARE